MARGWGEAFARQRFVSGWYQSNDLNKWKREGDTNQMKQPKKERSVVKRFCLPIKQNDRTVKTQT